MNLKFLKNKPFVAGTGQAWMFNIDYLTDSLNYSRVSSTNLTAGSQGATPSNAGSSEDDSDSYDEPDVLIIQSTPTPVVPIVEEATTQNDGTKSDHAKTNADNLDELAKLQALQRQEQAGTEEAGRLGLAFPSLNSILGVGSAFIGSSISVGSTPPVSAGSTPLMSPCASPIFANRHSISTGKRHVSAGRPTGSAGRPVSAGRPSGSADRTPVPAGRILGKFTTSASSERFPRASNVEILDIHDVLKIFVCPKSGIFTSRYMSHNPEVLKTQIIQGKSTRLSKALYGLHQALRACYERLSTFLLKHGYKRGTIDKILFIKKDSKDIILVHVYIDDIIFGSIRKDWCEEFETLMQSEFATSSMGPLTFFLGLQVDQRLDGIFIHQEKYIADILKKFDLDNSKLASTPFEPQKIREKNVPDEPISVHLYRSMIGCLMYLTATRPDIMFAVCAAARHQVTPKTSKLVSVKRIFKYLTAYPKLGLWYPRDSPFDLEAFSNSDYA
nr:putative ribonuclease H-like domain-containing protein [Tanacetum cinerariifolium]